ncbi:MAG: glycosyltransferase family 87 protein [Nitrospiraceae bacterium]
MVDPGVGFLLRYVVALGCLWLTLQMLDRMVWARREADASGRSAAAALTLVLASYYLLRDLDDGGPHLILLAIVVGGIYCVWKGREGLGAIWFGLTTALKVTPGLFLPFLLSKRQWRLAACTAAAIVGWIVLPAVWMGPASWWSHQQEWTRVARP